MKGEKDMSHKPPETINLKVMYLFILEFIYLLFLEAHRTSGTKSKR